MLSETPGRRLVLVFGVPPAWPAPDLKGSAPTQNSCFSGLWFRFRAYTLHLVSLASLSVRLSPSSHYTSERLTRPYSGELPACAALSQLANIARLPRSLIGSRPVAALPSSSSVRCRGSFFGHPCLRLHVPFSQGPWLDLHQLALPFTHKYHWT